jgi:hypothetical protein
MVAIPIISGISAKGADFRSEYPVNMVPVPKVQGISQGYIRPAPGVVEVSAGLGADRGGTQWEGVLYRVMGGNLYSFTEAGVPTLIGMIDGTNPAGFAKSFDRLAIRGGNSLYYWDGTLFSQVTDVDLGDVLDVVWVDGYFMTTDGAALVVTELNDPFAVNPLKYGSSEINPDPVVGLRVIRNEVYALNRYTIEVFNNTGGAAFPFQRVNGAQIMRGAVGTDAACEFMQALAFLGGGENDPPSVWIGGGGAAEKISTREIDDMLRVYTEDELAGVVLESRADRGHEFLMCHLPDQCFVFDGSASKTAGQAVWHILKTDGGRYKARGHVWCYGRWNVGDPVGTSQGYLTTDTGAHYGVDQAWEFTTPIIFNEGLGMIIHELELVALTGSVAPGNDPLIGAQYSIDGEVWSQLKYIRAGKAGERGKRLVWYQQGFFRNWRVQRFTGDTRAHLAFARLDARMETLAV